MKAAVWRGSNGTVAIEPVSLVDPGPRDVAVRVAAVAICHSDLAFLDGAWESEHPAIFGHEASGVVERVGREVSHVAPGDRVCVTLARSCFDCVNCHAGRPVDCIGQTPLDGRVVIHGGNGTPIMQGLKTGAFAEHVLVDHSQVAPFPQEMPWTSAAVLSCATLTGYGAVSRTAQFSAGQTAMVIGAGGVGLNCVQAAAIEGASHIIAVDLAPERLDAALEFGAHSTVNPNQSNMVDAAMARTGGLGVDRVFVCAASERIIDEAVLALAPGGAVVIVGMPRTGVTCSYDPLVLATANRSIMGSKFGQAVVHDDIRALASLYLQNKLKLDELITRTFPFEKINDALDAARRGEGLRSVVVFDWAKGNAA